MLNDQLKLDMKVKLLQSHNGMPMYAALAALVKKFNAGEVTLTNEEIAAEMNERKASEE